MRRPFERCNLWPDTPLG